MTIDSIHAKSELQCIEEGATLVEMGVLILLISLLALAAVTDFGEEVLESYCTLSERVDNAGATGDSQLTFTITGGGPSGKQAECFYIELQPGEGSYTWEIWEI